jgi:lipopolysaccharide export system protein LptA
MDSLMATMPRGDIETTINYSARDSIQFEVDRKVVHLYGDAKIDYGTMELQAAYIQIDYDANTLTATTLVDSTGKEVGTPVFKDGAESYAAKRIAYNYKTRKGRISEVVTQQGEGYIHSEVVKKNENNEIFGLHNKYTTCNLEHPHFYINAGKIKAIPNDKIMSGPFNLVIADIPTPLGFLFGLFPTPRNQRSSGVIMPTFGESRARGFFLSNGGYYLALNDYIGTRITGDIYSLGGYRVTIDNTYISRYSYRGNFNISYDYFKNDEADVADPNRSTTNLSGLPPSQRTAFVNWSHSPVQKPGRGRFTANVRAGSSQHNRVSLTSQNAYLSPTFNSTITYQKNIQNTPFSYTATLSQGQNNGGFVGQGENQRPAPTRMNFVLPDLNFAMTQMSIYEMFSNNVPTGKWYENFTFGYNVRARNEVSNVEAARTLGSVPVIGERATEETFPIDFDNLGRLWQNGRKSADHNFNIGLGNYKVMRFFNLAPSVSYRESWFDNKYSYTFDSERQAVRIDTAGFGRVYEYNAGASLNTTVYGTVLFPKGKKVEAIRHVMRPSVGYAYSPNYTDQDRFGFFQTTQTGIDSLTNQPTFQTFPRFGGNVPSGTLASGLSLRVDNQIQMKVRSRSDSAATATEKVSIIDNLGIGTFYNFAADSLRLSPINMSLNTRLLQVFDVNLSSIFDPYQIGTDGRRIDRYMLEGDGFKLARLTSANLSVRANFNPAARTSNTAPPPNLPGMMNPVDPLMPDYVDFNIPWTLSMDYTIFYTGGTPQNPGSLTQNIGTQGTLNITEKWKIGFMAGYDFSNKNISNANVDIYRDLHCWEMSIGWRPFGLMRGYNVTINARSSLLRDLRLTRNRAGMNFR